MLVSSLGQPKPKQRVKAYVLTVGVLTMKNDSTEVCYAFNKVVLRNNQRRSAHCDSVKFHEKEINYGYGENQTRSHRNHQPATGTDHRTVRPRRSCTV